MDTTPIDPTDTTKLYNYRGIPRYGRRTPTGSILFEEIQFAGGRYLEVESDDDWPILFDVQFEGRCPLADEWAAWNGSPIRLPRW